MQPSLPNTAFSQEQKLAQYCRTGKYSPLRGITGGRVAYYRKLVFNVVEDTLQSAFPLASALLDRKWEDLVITFFANHRCQSFQVWKMPLEFYEYVLQHDLPVKMNYPQLTGLLLFEWMEIDLFMREDRETGPVVPDGELITDELVINPEYEILVLDYPVHSKAAHTISAQDRGSYPVLIFRHPLTSQVHFLEISPFFAWLIKAIRETGRPVYQLATEAGQVLRLPPSEIMIRCREFLTELYQQQFILGFKPLNAKP